MRKISFILPVLNEAAHITQQLSQLQVYRDQGHEVIVVDGGSSDGSGELAAELADAVLSSDSGRGRQMNRGAQAATGDILLFLHSDTRLPVAADQLVLKALAGGDGEWGWFAVRLSNTALPYRIISTFMNLRSRLTFVATGDQTLFISRALFEREGGYPDIELMEDVAICKQLRRKSTPNWVLQPVVTSSRRWEQNGLARTIGLMWWLRFLYFCGVSPAQLRKLYYPSALAESGPIERPKSPRSRK